MVGGAVNFYGSRAAIGLAPCPPRLRGISHGRSPFGVRVPVHIRPKDAKLTVGSLRVGEALAVHEVLAARGAAHWFALRNGQRLRKRGKGWLGCGEDLERCCAVSGA